MKLTIKDVWIRIIGIALLTALILVSDDTYQQPITGPILVKLLVAFSTICLTWQLNRAIILYYRFNVAWPRLVSGRWLLILLSCSLATTGLRWFMAAFEYGIFQGTFQGFIQQTQSFSLTLNGHTFRLASFGFDWLLGLGFALFFNFLYGILFFIQASIQYRQRLELAEREKERLRVISLQSQLDVLKQQVNPHFLFNALNTLSSLIDESPPQASQFVDELSGVYRYLLQSNERSLTPLETELRFIESYSYLLRTRYGTGLSIQVQVPADYQSYQLPPLTLQLLVENAVKHNILSADRPLVVEIGIEAGRQLRVRNNLQRKNRNVLSHGVGLTNISARYQMLGQANILIEEANGFFTVTLPLLDSELVKA